MRDGPRWLSLAWPDPLLTLHGPLLRPDSAFPATGPLHVLFLGLGKLLTPPGPTDGRSPFRFLRFQLDSHFLREAFPAPRPHHLQHGNSGPCAGFYSRLLFPRMSILILASSSDCVPTSATGPPRMASSLVPPLLYCQLPAQGRVLKSRLLD